MERFGFIKKKFPEILLFDDYILSFEVGYMKPHPEIYTEALKKARVPARRMCVRGRFAREYRWGGKNGYECHFYGPQTDLEVRLKELNVAF